ncbi:MAG: hypothetical protein EHM20_13755, partial [Alphaproteobacteria bacterium]
MVDPGIQLQNAREMAIASLDRHLKSEYGAERLSTIVNTRQEQFKAGWDIILEVEHKQFEIKLLVNETFPFAPPTLYFKKTDLFLKFPHVDKNGKICLTNSATTFSPNKIVETANFLITKAKELITDSLAGRNIDDFVQEFNNYWNLLSPFSGIKFWSLLKPLSNTRVIFYYTARYFTVFGDTEEEVKAWIKNYTGGTLPKDFTTEKTIFLWLQEPLRPTNYPQTANHILDLARKYTENADALLSKIVPKKFGQLPILLGFETKTGTVMAGVEIIEPKKTKSTDFKKKRNCRLDGFRAGSISNSVLLSRYFGFTKLVPQVVELIDAVSCLQRGGGLRNHKL